MLEIDDNTLPAVVEREKAKGYEIQASYNAETVVRVRGARWALHRRTAGESSAHFISYQRIKEKRPIYLYTGYLLESARASNRAPLGFSLDCGVLVPEYYVDRDWRLDRHFDGGYIYRDKINFDLSLTSDSHSLKYGFDSRTPNRATKKLEPVVQENVTEFRIPVVRTTKPGLSANFVIQARPWS